MAEDINNGEVLFKKIKKESIVLETIGTSNNQDVKHPDVLHGSEAKAS